MSRPQIRHTARRTVTVARRATVEFVEDSGHRSAAQVAFFAVLSFIPLLLLLAAAFGLFFDEEEVLALELYFEQFADLGAVYGSLGAAMALLLFVYAAANVIVFGAEFAAEWSRSRDEA